MIGRRRVLSGLVGAPIAAKAAAAEVAGLATSGALSGGPSPSVMEYAKGQIYAGEAAAASVDRSWLRERLTERLAELAGLGKRRDALAAEARRNLTRLDPDLAANRSFSLVAKFRLQAERLADYSIALEGSYLEQKIAGIRKELGL